MVRKSCAVAALASSTSHFIGCRVRHLCHESSHQLYKNCSVPDTDNVHCEIDRMIRVDHAGEYGAIQIYAAQIAVLGPGDPALKKTLEHMREQEYVHLSALNRLI